MVALYLAYVAVADYVDIAISFQKTTASFECILPIKQDNGTSIVATPVTP